MKKIICTLFLLVFVCSLKAQNTTVDVPGRWRLGGNMGAILESSDVKTLPGLGGGFTLEKILNKRATAPIGFSLGFRYLGGRTYGLNTSPTIDLKDNKALNGTYDSIVRYDSLPGYFYANHKTFIQEGSLELKVNFPRFEQRTRIIFHLWGGVGIGKFKTWIDAKDKDGKIYDLTSAGGKPVNESDLNRIYGGSYESLAEGSDPSGTIRFVPSAGVGLGVRLSRNVALVFEHKVSFPGTDYLDGITYPTGHINDFYHYSSANLIFTMYAKSKSTSTSTHNNTNVVTNTNTTQTVTTNNTVTTNTVPVTTNTVTINKPNPPSVRITYPGNNFNSQYDNVAVSVQLKNITSSQQIGITLNGYPLSHFSFNPSNGALNFQSFLAVGNNYFLVSASNADGTASDNVTVIYKPVTNTVTTGTNTVSISTPTVAITNTVSTGTGTVSIGTPTVAATNTVSTGTGTVSIGTPTVAATNTVTTGTGTVSINTPTVATTPTIAVTNTATVGGKPPVVQIINPAVNPHKEENTSYNVSASVLNIVGGNELSITVNGNTVTQFTFGKHNKMLNFFAPLQPGNNVVLIKATNKFGSDSKTTTIIHHGKPPKVVISTPASSPYTSLIPSTTVSGFVYQVKAAADIKVTANGNVLPFNFNPTTGSIDLNLVLQVGNTTVTISGTNSFGSDAQSVTLIHKKAGTAGGTIDPGNTGTTTTTSTVVPPGGLPKMPVVTILSPNSNPYNTNTASAPVTAEVLYVTAASDVKVSKGGSVVPSSYDLNSKKVSFTAQLAPGMNSFVISGTNSFGSDSKTQNINYTPVINTGTVNPVKGGPEQQISICHTPPGNPNNPQQITIPISAWPAHQAHGDVQGNCPVPEQQISICHTPPGNPNNPQQITIPISAWPAHQAHGDVQGTCPTNNGNGNNGNGGGNNSSGNNDPQITICHIPPGNPNNPQQISIPTSAWPAHQAHGDTQGACPTTNNGNNGGGNGGSTSSSGQVGVGGLPGGGGNSDPQITICHIPPGNPNNPQQITIATSAWPAHQAHGDTQGACPTNTNNGNNGNGGGNGNNNSGGNNSGGNTDPEITICHIPPGNPNNPQQISIPTSAWPAHQAHGDTQGTCPTNNGNGNGNGGGNGGNGGKDGKGNNGGGGIAPRTSGGNENNSNTNAPKNNGGLGGLLNNIKSNTGGNTKTNTNTKPEENKKGNENSGRPTNTKTQPVNTNTTAPANGGRPANNTQPVNTTTTTPVNGGSTGRPTGGGGGK